MFVSSDGKQKAEKQKLMEFSTLISIYFSNIEYLNVWVREEPCKNISSKKLKNKYELIIKLLSFPKNNLHYSLKRYIWFKVRINESSKLWW